MLQKLGHVELYSSLGTIVGRGTWNGDRRRRICATATQTATATRAVVQFPDRATKVIPLGLVFVVSGDTVGFLARGLGL